MTFGQDMRPRNKDMRVASGVTGQRCVWQGQPSVTSLGPLVAQLMTWPAAAAPVRCCVWTGPCYRCLFPEAPAPENCSRCADAGVLGVVPGIMGCLQVCGTVGHHRVLGRDMRWFEARCWARSPSACAFCWRERWMAVVFASM